MKDAAPAVTRTGEMRLAGEAGVGAGVEVAGGGGDLGFAGGPRARGSLATAPRAGNWVLSSRLPAKAGFGRGGARTLVGARRLAVVLLLVLGEAPLLCAWWRWRCWLLAPSLLRREPEPGEARRGFAEGCRARRSLPLAVAAELDGRVPDGGWAAAGEADSLMLTTR